MVVLGLRIGNAMDTPLKLNACISRCYNGRRTIMPNMTKDLMPRLYRLLVRGTSGGPLVPQIDGLRFFAIALVLLYHLNGYFCTKSTITFQSPPQDSLLYKTLSQGFIGVQMFFAISGFILSLPFARWHLLGGPHVPLRAYFLRRLTRLEPPYIINLLCLFVLLWIVTGATPAEQLPHLLASLVYQHNLIYGDGSTINFVAWSLEIEVQFYILAPLLTMVFAVSSKVMRRLILAAAILGFGLLQYRLGVDIAHGLNLLHELHYFLVGFLVADFYCTDWSHRPPRHGWAWDSVAAALWLALAACLISSTAEHLLPALCFLGIFIAAFRGRLWVCTLCNPVIYLVGGMCYTIYLYHPMIKSGFGRILIRLGGVGTNYQVNVALFIAVTGTVILVISALLYVAFEKPFMRRDWPRRMASWWPKKARTH